MSYDITDEMLIRFLVDVFGLYPCIAKYAIYQHKSDVLMIYEEMFDICNIVNSFIDDCALNMD